MQSVCRHAWIVVSISPFISPLLDAVSLAAAVEDARAPATKVTGAESFKFAAHPERGQGSKLRGKGPCEAFAAVLSNAAGTAVFEGPALFRDAR